VYGTASTVQAFVLVEWSGPWGSDALRDARLPAAVAAHLRRAGARGVRPLLVRRHGRSDPGRSDPGRSDPGRMAVFAAYADPHQPWLESAVLDGPEQLCDLDLGALASGASVGLALTDEPVFLACTHGRHDRCCAERGRPLAAALARSHPAESWEVSHIGGDRFAGNLLVLPDGLYYGRLSPGDATALVGRHLAGHLDLAHLRGRSGYGFAVQAAEWFLRMQLGVTGRHSVRLTARAVRGQQTEALFVVEEQAWRVVVASRQSPAQLLTCGSARPDAAPLFELVDIEPAATAAQ